MPPSDTQHSAPASTIAPRGLKREKRKINLAACWTKARKCKYCKAIFTPERPQDWNQKFCQDDHRKKFWMYGGLPYDKMRESLMLTIRAQVNDMLGEVSKKVLKQASRINQLEKRLEKLDGKQRRPDRDPGADKPAETTDAEVPAL